MNSDALPHTPTGQVKHVLRDDFADGPARHKQDS
jgi:hypothetical protein